MSPNNLWAEPRWTERTNCSTQLPTLILHVWCNISITRLVHTTQHKDKNILAYQYVIVIEFFVSRPCLGRIIVIILGGRHEDGVLKNKRTDVRLRWK